MGVTFIDQNRHWPQRWSKMDSMEISQSAVQTVVSLSKACHCELQSNEFYVHWKSPFVKLFFNPMQVK